MCTSTRLHSFQTNANTHKCAHCYTHTSAHVHKHTHTNTHAIYCPVVNLIRPDTRPMLRAVRTQTFINLKTGLSIWPDLSYLGFLFILKSNQTYLFTQSMAWALCTSFCCISPARCAQTYCRMGPEFLSAVFKAELEVKCGIDVRCNCAAAGGNALTSIPDPPMIFCECSMQNFPAASRMLPDDFPTK
jgi:hypothetical protein